MRMPRRVPNPEWKPIGYAPLEGLKLKDKAMERLAKQFLDSATELFDASTNMDTTVRDSVCTGLAYLVNCGYDCQACAYDLDLHSFHDFRDKKTIEWFRSRGFAEWFCQGAGVLFTSSQPHVYATVTTKGRRKSGVVRMKRVAVA